MASDRLALVELSGTPNACGEAYGAAFALPLMGFCRQEVTPTLEIVHQPHCTALAAAGTATHGTTIIAQNWDWAPQLYPWAGLLRLALRGSPRVVTYHYPGLWACAGINEHGLALMWTGGGYFPLVPPVVGLPT